MISVGKWLKEIQIQNCFLKKTFSKAWCEKYKAISPFDSFKLQNEPISFYRIILFHQTIYLHSLYSSSLSDTLSFTPGWPETLEPRWTLYTTLRPGKNLLRLVLSWGLTMSWKPLVIHFQSLYKIEKTLQRNVE